MFISDYILIKFNILKMFIENILGTESKIKILRSLLEINTGFTIEELEKETGLSRGIIHRELRRLEKSKIIQQVEKKGKLGYYKIDLNNQYSQLLAKLFEIEKLQEKMKKKRKINREMNVITMKKSKFNKDKTDLIREVKREGILLYGKEELFILGNSKLGEAVLS